MKSNFKLEYSYRFENDFEKINNYIKFKLQNPIAANNLLQKVQNEIFKRLKNPLNYEKYKTRKDHIYYRIYVNNYIIFYTVDNNIMKVRRILYNKRNLDKLFK